MSENNRTDVAMFVEDPGAANFVAFLPEELHTLGFSSRTFASTLAQNHLARFHKVAEPFPQGDSAAILENVNPECLLVGTAANPDSRVLDLIRCARENDIVTVGVIDALMNVEMRFRGRTENPLAFAPDWLLVPTASSKEDFENLGFSSERIIVTGTPHFDTLKQFRETVQNESLATRRSRHFPNAQGPVLLFAAEGSERSRPQTDVTIESYTLRGLTDSRGRTNIILEELRESMSRTGLKPYFVLRIHPKDTRDDYATFSDLFDEISSGGNPYDLVCAADLVVGMTSMLLTESVILGRPTLSILPRAQEASWLPSIQSGLTRCALTRSEIDQSLVEMLSSFSGPSAENVERVFPSGALRAASQAISKIMRNIPLDQIPSDDPGRVKN